jgi:hypothetical protein
MFVNEAASVHLPRRKVERRMPARRNFYHMLKQNQVDFLHVVRSGTSLSSV